LYRLILFQYGRIYLGNWFGLRHQVRPQTCWLHRIQPIHPPTSEHNKESLIILGANLMMEAELGS
jgi:hypothetical protein